METSLASSSSTSIPLTRSRTLFFLSIRSTFSHPGSSSSRRNYNQRTSYDDDGGDDDDEHAGLIGRDGGKRDKGKGRETRIDMEQPGLPPIWVDVSDSVNALLSDASSKMSRLDRLHAKHVLPGFKDRSAEEREIESMTTSITRDFRLAQAKIKSIQSTSRTRAELSSAANVQRGLASKVQELSGTFRRKQRIYMQKLQGHAIKNADHLTRSGGGNSLDTGGVAEMQDDLQASQFQLQQSTMISNNLDVTIRQRDQELSSIAKSITELATLFQDLNDMVLEQGTLLDSVEYNLEVVAQSTQGAVEELKVATTYQKNSGRRTCIFLLVLICFGLVIVIIYKPRSRSVSTLPPIAIALPSSSLIPVDSPSFQRWS